MTKNEAISRVKLLFKRIVAYARNPSRKLMSQKSLPLPKNVQATLKSPHSMAYQLIGERAEHVLPLFKDLDLNLQKAGLKIGFRAYVSLTLFTTLFLALATLGLIPPLLSFVFRVPLFPALMLGMGTSLFAFAFTIIGFYVYPIYRADKLKRELEDELPFTTGYMAILSSAGVSPEKIFYSLSTLSVPLTVTQEAKNIAINVNLFGADIISALEETSKRTPSERFREMLEGFISTIHSGGNLSGYLRDKSRQYMKLKRISLRKFSDTLSTLSEFYVALLVTGPLLLVIMLAVMTMLGGGNLGILSPELLLQILTYIGIPVGSIMFLVILDAISPKW